MDLYAICTTLNAGTDFDKKAIVEAGIKVGDKIPLVNAEVGKFHTNVYLKGYPKSFNSVFFNFVDENGEDYDIYSDESFYTFI